MKTIFLMHFFSFLVLFSNGQNFAIAADKENVFYLGLDNPVTLAVENFSCESIIVKTSNGEISGENCRYMYRPDKIGPVVFTLHKNIKGNLKEIGKSNFRVKRIWDPIFKIGSGKDSIRLKEIQAQQFVRAQLEGSDFNLVFSIERFTVCIISKDTCRYIERINFGNKLSEEVREILQKLNVNDTIIFKEIICVGPDGKRKIAPAIITVIE